MGYTLVNYNRSEASFFRLTYIKQRTFKIHLVQNDIFFSKNKEGDSLSAIPRLQYITNVASYFFSSLEKE